MTKNTHDEDLKDVRWLKRRIDILQKRDFKCELCCRTYNLQIHHKRYKKGHRLWEYDDDELMCLCGECHEKQHELRELNLKGDFLLLPLEHDNEEECYYLPAVDSLFNSSNIYPEQSTYLMVSKRGFTYKNIGKNFFELNVARLLIDSFGPERYTIFPVRFRADKMSGSRGSDTSLRYIWDNDDYDPSYVEFTKLPPFEYDLAVICIDEQEMTGWHKGKASELFHNIHVL